MILFSLIFSSFIFYAKGGELIIAEAPLSVKFQGDEAIDQHLVPEIFSAAMGFTTQRKSDWRGMVITDPFSFAEAIVVLYISGIPTLSKSSVEPKYTLNNDETELVTWKRIKNKIADRYPLENNTVMRIELGERENELKTQYFEDDDNEFIKEISHLNKFIKNVKKSDGVPDLYWFSMKSLHSLSDLKGPNDASTLEAKEKTYEILQKLGKIFSSAYNDKALVVGLVSDASHTRRTRAAAEEKPDTPEKEVELTDNIFDPDFPVIFNIILWFTVALVFSLLAVSVFIASMDPGRDSIIYRMTSNRIKKDS